MSAGLRALALLVLLGMAWPLVARAQACVASTAPDWMTAIPMSASSARVWPVDCAAVEQSPPDFSWPDLAPDAQYQVTLTYPGGNERTLAAPQNWINWDEVLPAGSYVWRVQVSSASGTQTSNSRRFTVTAGAGAFVVPDWATLFARATAKAHPRALPDAVTAGVMIAQRQAGWLLLLARVNASLNAALPPEPAITASADAITRLVNDESRRMLESALAWLVSGDQAYLADALRRAQNLAAWDPYGSTAYSRVDEASAQIAVTLALVYDWLHPWLDADQKTQWVASIVPRANDMYYDLIGTRARIAVYPYDSHGSVTLTYLAVISTLLAGDVPQAQVGLRDSLPLALHWTSPWGLEDGGFGNGSAYATWTNGSLLVAWYVLRWTVGVDLAQKSWTRNYANFLAYFLPPGTPAGGFGDAAEAPLIEAWARYGKAYALFAPRPIARWYAEQRSGEDPAALELLLAPPGDPSPAPYPAGTPHATLLPSIGWAALHSDLADPARTSVYFKSSSYGSYNHSHADQNSFVVNAGGQALAIDSGYYDGYMTPHWWQWYKQTRAHNAITFDGGQGQSVYEASGQLGAGATTAFTHQPGYDIVQGDATPAYGGALSRAQRSLVYLRPDLLLVYDNLASATPRQWEWNIHALEAMAVTSDTRISIARNGRSLCIDMLAGPPLHFAQASQFSADPVSGFSWTPQWHGAFTSASPSAATEFIALLRVGCAPGAASANKAGGVWTVLAGGRTVTIGESGAISVQ